MQKLRLGLCGALTASGIGWPWYCIYKFVRETEVFGLTNPFGIVNLFSAGVWANASSGFISADLKPVLIASFILYAAEGMRICMKRWSPYIPFTFAISFALSYDLFIFNREKLILHKVDWVDAFNIFGDAKTLMILTMFHVSDFNTCASHSCKL